MNYVLNVNGQKAIRIPGKIIKVLDKATLIDCDGDQQWSPHNTFRDNRDGTIDIQQWIYDKKFPNG